MDRLRGKVALVTGAAQGIGAVLARALAEEGASVAVTDVADPAASASAITSAGGKAIGIRMDVTDNASITAAVAQIEASFGHIGVLVNNAGIFTALRSTPFLQMSEEEFDQVMKVNVRGTFQVTKGVVPSMKRGGGGKVINVSSGTFFYGAPGLLHYVASKSAIIGMTRTMSRELADAGIFVNCVAPGLTETEGVKSHPDFSKGREPTIAQRALKRAMTPEDLIGAVLFLATSDSDFMTGQMLNIDGGKANY